MLNLTNEERETQINWCNADKEAEVWTYDSRIIRELEKAGAEIRDGEFGAKVAVIPKKWIKIRAPRVLSEAQLEAARKSLLKIRAC